MCAQAVEVVRIGRTGGKEMGEKADAGMASGGAGGGGGVPYLGALISLISKSEFRYEGTLYSINTQESTILLQNVRCFGTEGRRRDAAQTEPSPQVYDFISFRGTDIKDLHVMAQQPYAPPPPMTMQHMPPQGMMNPMGYPMQMGPAGASQPGRDGLPPYAMQPGMMSFPPQMAPPPYGYRQMAPGMPVRSPGGYPGPGMEYAPPPNPYMWGPGGGPGQQPSAPPLMPQPPSAPPLMPQQPSAPPLPPQQLQEQAQPQQSQVQQPQYVTSYTKAQADPQTELQGQRKGLESAAPAGAVSGGTVAGRDPKAAAPVPAARPQTTATAPRNEGTFVSQNGSDPQSSELAPLKAAESTSSVSAAERQTHANRRGASGPGAGRPGSFKAPAMPKEDFDFEAMNEQFTKQQIEEEEKILNDMRFEKKYDKGKSFFDELAPEKEEARRGAAGRPSMREQRGIDVDTFGEAARYYRPLDAGRGGYRGGQRGGSGRGGSSGGQSSSRGSHVQGSRKQGSTKGSFTTYSGGNTSVITRKTGEHEWA
ncbi:Protein decapping 5 [Porphyridium purpureum]|uniref:Protein decapping 5 n=1 Tax=Porphyridium purpureum TaxID=35688 RepID=A0A5J4Z5P4_PORPP|nr:Protein decapping 5 [Porphyridium purpureum]|eukprot:POR4194..scf295_1